MNHHVLFLRAQKRKGTPHFSLRRRSAVAVLFVFTIPVVFGMAALTVDVAYLYGVRADLQTSADAAALAGASALHTDAMMQIRMGTDDTLGTISYTTNERAGMFSTLNTSLGKTSTIIESNQIMMGFLDLSSATSSIQTSVAPSQINAVGVTVRRTSDSVNGPVDLMFARIFGISTSDVTALAVAAYDDKAAGFDTAGYPGGLLPFTVHEDVYEAGFATGPDQYAWDAFNESILSGSDGVREVKLYPHNSAPGNFGLLNIGTPNQGTPALRNHIENGVPPEDFEAEVGTSVLTFYDDNGNPITNEMTGNPGMKASLESSLETRLGQVVGVFLHNNTSGAGANTVYTITQLRFGRLMHAKLKSGQKAVWMQPTSFTGSSVILSEKAPSSGGMVGMLVLAR